MTGNRGGEEIVKRSGIERVRMKENREMLINEGRCSGGEKERNR